jgi:hypothetical protein
VNSQPQSLAISPSWKGSLVLIRYEMDGPENWSKFVEDRSSTDARSSVVELYQGFEECAACLQGRNVKPNHPAHS